MKLTHRSEYAFLALLFLARQGEGRYVTVQAIAREQDIPAQFLEHILLALKKARYVVSQKGHGGGYRLARKPERIPLAEIIRLLDGALAPTESVSRYFYEPTPIEKEKGLIRVFKRIRDFVASTLESTTLADVL
jgi:Rrf2 family protein